MKGRTLSPILHGVVLLLLPFGCATLTEPQSQNSLLLRLAAAGTAEQVLDAIRKGAEANAKDEGSGWTPLLYAARLNRRPEVVSALLKAGADIDARTQGGLTALMEASGYNPNPEVVSALLLGGASVNARDYGGMTALMWAASANSSSAVIYRSAESRC